MVREARACDSHRTGTSAGSESVVAILLRAVGGRRWAIWNLKTLVYQQLSWTKENAAGPGVEIFPDRNMPQPCSMALKSACLVHQQKSRHGTKYATLTM